MGGSHSSLLLRGSSALATLDSSIRRSCYDLKEVSTDAGVLERLDSLDDLPGGLELNEVVRSSAKLLAFVRSYLKEVHGVLRVLAELRAGSAKAEANLAAVHAAISLFDEEEKIRKASKKRKKSKKYVQALENFMQADEPLTAVESQKLRAACQKLEAMMAELRKRKDDLGGRLASTKRRRKAWKAAYTAAVIAALAVSVALAAVVMPPAAIAGATATATAMKAVEHWFDTMWDDKERGLAGERKAAKMMRRAAMLEVQDLEGVRALAEKVSAGIGTVRDLAQFPMAGDAEGVKVAMEGMRRKTTELEGGIRHLKLKVDLCDAEVNKVAAQFLKNIIK